MTRRAARQAASAVQLAVALSATIGACLPDGEVTTPPQWLTVANGAQPATEPRERFTVTVASMSAVSSSELSVDPEWVDAADLQPATGHAAAPQTTAAPAPAPTAELESTQEPGLQLRQPGPERGLARIVDLLPSAAPAAPGITAAPDVVDQMFSGAAAQEWSPS